MTAKHNSSTPSERYHVPSLARALRACELLASSTHGLSIAQITRQLDIPQNSAFRIVTTLRDRGYLEYDDADRSYCLSRKFMALGHAVGDRQGLVSKSADILEDLCRETGETALVGGLFNDGGVVLNQVVPNQPVKVSVQIGHRFPLHTAAPAKAMLAYLPDQQRERLLDGCSFERFNSTTITSRDIFMQELEVARDRGYALDRGEECSGVACVAAPVFDHRAHPIAALWVTGPIQRMPQPRWDRLAAIVVRHAARLSERMGCPTTTRLGEERSRPRNLKVPSE